jgi:uncharacterized repeat protein (TIGR03837 family)
MTPMLRNWDIFCQVIDNYGDIGVCWRLARQLANEHGLVVRLWVDQPEVLAAFCPVIDPSLPVSHYAGVEIRRWTPEFPEVTPADVVIEAFACELPARYQQAMATSGRQRRWINLEYLTAEPWAESCHGLASPHPSLGLTKHFFFPGFSPSTGGLLREALLIERCESWQAQQTRDGWLNISLFCYDSAPVGGLIDLLAASEIPIRCHVPPGQPLAAVSTCLGGSGPWQRGMLTISPIPFLPQDEFDQLLWRCDINFVRGEDSLVRAIWAGKPMIWQIYKQDDQAHLGKLAAFLDTYTQGMSASSAAALKAIFTAWNTGQGLQSAWPNFMAWREEITESHKKWRKKLLDHGDIASQLVNFCAGDI